MKDDNAPKPDARKIKETLGGFEKKLRSLEELEAQLKQAMEDQLRDPSPRTLGYCYGLLGFLKAYADSNVKITFYQGELDALNWFTGVEG